jgi:uncharacterized protein YbbK (DUF523 family)
MIKFICGGNAKFPRKLTAGHVAGCIYKGVIDMAVILVSACLLGCECRYKGDGKRSEFVAGLAKDNILIPVCPEQMGGLPTPRDPSEIRGDKVISSSGSDVTSNYERGAKMACDIARMNEVDFAIMKAKSPSCGKGMIYDGTFSGTLIEGNGITVSRLLEADIPVYTENDVEDIEEVIYSLNFPGGKPF